MFFAIEIVFENEWMYWEKEIAYDIYLRDGSSFDFKISQLPSL